MTRPFLAALLLAACGAPTSSGAPDAATSDRPVGWAPSGQEVLGPAECQPGLLACQRRFNVRLPPAPDAGWFCIRRDNPGHCGACYAQCLSGTCSAGDAGLPVCAP